MWQRGKERGEQLLGLFVMVTGGCPIPLDQLWDLSKGYFVTRLQILRRFPDVVVIREKLIPVLLLLLSDRIVVLPSGGLGRFLQAGNELSCPSLSSSAVSPVGIDAPQLRQVSRPPTLCMW